MHKEEINSEVASKFGHNFDCIIEKSAGHKRQYSIFLGVCSMTQVMLHGTQADHLRTKEVL